MSDLVEHYAAMIRRNAPSLGDEHPALTGIVDALSDPGTMGYSDAERLERIRAALAALAVVRSERQAGR